MSEVNQAASVATSATPAMDNEEMLSPQMEQMEHETPQLDDEDVTAGSDGDSGPEVLIADTDDADKVAVFKAADFEDMSEEELIAAMGTADEIRSTQTVPTGDYIVTLSPVLFDKHVNYVAKVNADGVLVPVRMKNIGFRYSIVYSMSEKAAMQESGYQMFHTARKDGSVFSGGLTDYKRYCANAIAAVHVVDNPTTTMDKVLKMMDAKKVNPAVLYNQIATSDDDNKIYLRCRITESPATEKGPAQNTIVIPSFKSDQGYYLQMMEG